MYRPIVEDTGRPRPVATVGCVSDAETDAEHDPDDEGRAPICPACGVTALPAETAHVLDATFVCENPDCDAYGEPV